jgi:hypothetical protein
MKGVLQFKEFFKGKLTCERLITGMKRNNSKFKNQVRFLCLVFRAHVLHHSTHNTPFYSGAASILGLQKGWESPLQVEDAPGYR